MERPHRVEFELIKKKIRNLARSLVTLEVRLVRLEKSIWAALDQQRGA